MKKDEIFSDILGCSVSGFYKWKKQNRRIIDLLENYFSLQDLNEFINTGKISKFELIKDIDLEELEYLFKNKELIYKIAEIKTILGGKDA